MTYQMTDLAEFGWNPHFSAQLEPDDLEQAVPVRVTAVHRGAVSVAGPGVDISIPPYRSDPDDSETTATVGDWLLLDAETHRPRRMLPRQSLLKRRLAGTGRDVQLIAANVDTLFIVTSCNQDFNIPRLERYLALASEAEVTPVIILTKADLCDDPGAYLRQAYALPSVHMVESVNALDGKEVERLLPWCSLGQTVALVGSSGVGKSTLINSLTGRADIATQGIRDDDGKGRHTTTGRALHRMPSGGWVVDTPGIRELQLTDVQSGLDDVFSDIVDLARSCRFSTCRHDTEPDCAVTAAIEAGALEESRLERWRKLIAEEAFNSASLAQRRSRDKAFGKMVKRATKDKKDYLEP
ncbi:ribosome small subunit-dependent GTPase A [Hwanghaeella grinnelliae]|uniref:Small ribosomal subunit biogenesis GTPase RsgA n=1 Tax=Hwanghaeella grinnelliae TaxID=2500179 RepID=A0A3S2VSI1_9PROT|nr:ribosome small subunit-dependent GTPase A [Hwanghaeella grinnelliae]RVU39480.1 ribosome small subunit-dependent GTPase A [Hwanghaeella grinnelliae]